MKAWAFNLIFLPKSIFPICIISYKNLHNGGKKKEKEKYKILGGEIHRIEQNRQLHVYLINPWVKYINCAKISKYPATCPVYLAGVKISIYWNDSAGLF